MRNVLIILTEQSLKIDLLNFNLSLNSNADWINRRVPTQGTHKNDRFVGWSFPIS